MRKQIKYNIFITLYTFRLCVGNFLSLVPSTLKKNNMTEDNKDLQIKALVTELNNIKKDFAIKLEEIQALYLEIKQQKSINEDHQKLNGRLRLELEELKLNKVQAVEDAKKESDELMMKVISKYENKIKELKEEADEMLQYP